jgi:hypothetical protein
MLRAKLGAHVEVLWHYAALILKIINLFELHFHNPLTIFFIVSHLKIIDQENPDNNLESLCTITDFAD